MVTKHKKILERYKEIYFQLRKVMATENFALLQELLELERELTLLEEQPE